MHFSTSKIQFILSSEISEGGTQLWSGLTVSSLFEEYSIETLNNNEFGLEINLDHLSRAIKSAQQATEVLMKLTKKNGNPFLSFAISIQTSQQMTIIQDVPVVLLNPQQLANYTEPTLPDPEVYVLMPPLKHMQNVIDKMKNVEGHLTIFANMNGSLLLKVEADMVTIATFYKNLRHPQIEGRSPPHPDPDQSCEIKVDIKKFSKFLYSSQISPTNVICCMVEGKALVLHVLLEDLFLTYYIPAITI